MKRKTAYENPIFCFVFKVVTNIWVGLKGWKFEGEPNGSRKLILIGAPHTSNWDFIYMVIGSFKKNLKLFWMVKDSVFKSPLGPLANWTGGIPIERSAHHNMVDQMINLFNESEDLVLVNAPEGTRSKKDRWKTGFYYIALGAKVPIQLCSVDYPKKTVIFGLVLEPTGDIEADFKIIDEYYLAFEGKHHENYTRPLGELPKGEEQEKCKE
ncbi:MAG: lysophospholipid acyltransferase family protein [SAR324 cluster bacterium]|nr:lysophospholipid acyltransferase family protein [SAR324 cluster bacterium]